MWKYITVSVTPFQQNCSNVWCDQAKVAAIIDPGGDLQLLLEMVAQTSAKLEQIWLTYAHIDHAGATAELVRKLDLPIVSPHAGAT
jgi:hydroxyacylglutathione hydrolase